MVRLGKVRLEANIVGFITGHVGRNRLGRFEYQGQADCHYNLVLTGASFFHRYSLYVSYNESLICSLLFWLG